MSLTTAPDAYTAGFIPPQPRSRRPWLPRRRREPYLGAGTRLHGLDAARGLAIVGMVIAHAAIIAPWGTGPSQYLGIAHGHSSILFAVVAGVSLGIVTGGSGPQRDPLRTRWRVAGRAAALLLVSGLAAILPTAVATILASYALWFVLAIPALTWRPRTLLIVAAAHLLTGWLFISAARYALGWAHLEVSDTPETFVPSLILTGAYPAAVWMGFVLAGLALARLGLDRRRVLLVALGAGAGVFLAAAAPFVVQERSLGPVFGAQSQASTSLDAMPEDWCYDPAADALIECSFEEFEAQIEELTEEQGNRYFELLDAKLSGPPVPSLAGIYSLQPHSGTPFEAASSGGFAVALIAGLLLLGRARPARLIMAPLIVIGSMALTVYMAHLVVLAAIPNASESVGYAWWLILGLIAGAATWRSVFAQGPLEAAIAAFSDRVSTTAAGAVSPAAAPARPGG